MFDIAPNSRGNQFRARRVRMLTDLIERTLRDQPTCSILDIGGTYDFWQTWRHEIDWGRTSVTCVNLTPTHASTSKDLAPVKMIQGNACDLSGVQNAQFDIAFSNSVIEHVGQWSNMLAMAGEMRRVSRRYLVQTPNFWFPIEPHARTPFLHWLPQPWAYRIVMRRKCGFWSKAETVSHAVRTVQSAQMIDYRQFKELFHDAEIIRERLCGLTKSLIAIRV